jgi:acetyl/propionyl-CoA carboxylase alpha subunit
MYLDENHGQYKEHAIKYRIRPEDPDHNYAPCSGGLIAYSAQGRNDIPLGSHTQGRQNTTDLEPDLLWWHFSNSSRPSSRKA